MLTNSVTKTHTQTLQNGTTLTTEERMTDFQSLEIQTRIVLDTQEEFKQAILTSEQEVLSRLPISIINKNQYLKWRIADILDVSNKFHRLVKEWHGVVELFALCHNHIQGTGFLSRFAWGVCWDYGLLLYTAELAMEKNIARAASPEELHQHLANVGLNETTFLNDHMSSVLIDKILLNAYYDQADLTLVWPICVSGIPEVLSFNWCSSDVKVVKGVEFVFPMDKRLPHVLLEWRFKPPAQYFPLDLMLLLPHYKAVYQTQMEEDRREVLEQKELDGGYQFYLADRVKRCK